MAETFPSPSLSETLLLEPIHYRAARLLDRNTLYQTKVSSHAHHSLDALVLQLDAYVYAEKLLEREIYVPYKSAAVFPFPASPWQFFKQRHGGSWWLGWLVRRRPARTDLHFKEVKGTKRVVQRQFATFPQSPIRAPETARGPVAVRYETSCVLGG